MTEHVGEQNLEGRAAIVRALEAEFGSILAGMRKVYQEAAERVSEGMLPGTYKVFTTISRCGPVTSSHLAELMLADKGQISRTVKELEDRGLVVRTPDPADGRSSLLRSTEFGEEQLSRSRRENSNPLVAQLAQWSNSDIQDLTRLLHALVSGTNPSASDVD